MTHSGGSRFFWVRAAATLLILSFLLSRIDLAQLALAVRDSIGIWLLLALLSNSLPLVISTYKWDALLQALGISISTGSLLKLYTIGFFASSFLPGNVGGDLVRWQMTGERTGGHVKVAATILVERFTGVATLVLLCLPVVALHSGLATPPVLALLATVVLGLVAAGTLAARRRLAAFLFLRTRRRPLGRLFRKVYQLHRTLRGFAPKTLLVATAFSVLFYLGGGLTFLLVCRAFGVDIGLLEALSVQILRCLVMLVPISVGGLGLVQAGDVYLLGLLGVPTAHALGISLMRQLINYGYVLIGGILFIQGQHRPATYPGTP